jgi:hypothetical protein
MDTELLNYAIKCARPRMCEIQLSRFIYKCESCTTQQQVDTLLLDFIAVKPKQSFQSFTVTDQELLHFREKLAGQNWRILNEKKDGEVILINCIKEN